MTKEEKSKLLIIALKEEKERLSKHLNFDPIEHDVCIAYLESGTYDEDPEFYELLEAAIEDFDLLCSDYGII